MKKIYIAHEFQGKKQNKEAIAHICRALVKFGILPISPVHSFSYFNDHAPEEREKAMEFCDELVEMCDAIFLCGAWESSDGCWRERDVALQGWIPIYEVIGWDGDVPLFKGDGPKWL